MGRVVFLNGTLNAALAQATVDQDGRRWAIAHTAEGKTYVAWEGPGARVITRVGAGRRLLGEEVVDEPAGLWWDPMPVPRIDRRRAAA